MATEAGADENGPSTGVKVRRMFAGRGANKHKIDKWHTGDAVKTLINDTPLPGTNILPHAQSTLHRCRWRGNQEDVDEGTTSGSTSPSRAETYCPLELNASNVTGRHTRYPSRGHFSALASVPPGNS